MSSSVPIPIGSIFGEWIVLRKSKSKYGQVFTCRCSCGEERNCLGTNLRSGKSTSCGHGKNKKIELIAGSHYGFWVVLEESEPYISPNGWRKRQVRVKCICGNIALRLLDSLHNGLTKSCGCNGEDKVVSLESQSLVIPTGLRFSKLEILLEVASKTTIDGRHPRMFKCLCDCGKESIVSLSDLRTGHTKSCGCYHTYRVTTHGMYNTPEYKTWQSIKSRCLYPGNLGYRNYGGRGITICDRWLSSFDNFLADVGPKPQPYSKYSIDRINPNGNYEPTNVRWATAKEQASNKRTSHYITIDGIKRTATQWAEISGTHPSVVTMRSLAGWTPEDSVYGRTKRDKTSL